MQIITPTRCGADGRLRVYADPQWVRLDGVNWIPVADAVKVQAMHNAYRLSLGDQWIELTPSPAADAHIGLSLKRRVKQGTHFGQVLDAKNAPDSLAFRVTASLGVKREPGRWILGERDGVPLGLHLDDWFDRFPCEVKDNEITLDLTKAKAAGGEVGEINLDPTTIAKSALRNYILTAAEGGGWAAVVEAANAGSQEATLLVCTILSGGNFTCIRGAVRFDTSGVSAAQARLITSVTGLGANLHVCRCTLSAGLDDNADFAAIRTGYTDTAVGLSTQRAGAVFQSPDIVAAGQWAQSSTYTLGMALWDWDKPASYTTPTTTEHLAIVDPTTAPPYLEIISTGGATSTSTSTARRRPF